MDLLTKIQAQIEELEKRIKALSMQVTTSSYMTALKACIEELKNLMQSYVDEFNLHLSNYDLHVQECDQKILECIQTVDECEDVLQQFETIKVDFNQTQQLSQNTKQDLQSHIDTYNTFVEAYNNHIEEYNNLNAQFTDFHLNQDAANEANINQHNIFRSGIDNAFSRIEVLEESSNSNNTTIEELENNNQTLTNKVNQLETDNTSNKTSIQNINSTIASLNNTKNNLLYRVEDLEMRNTDLDIRVKNIEQGDDLQSDIVNFCDTIVRYPVCKSSNSFMSPKIYFYCETSQTVEVEYTVKGNISQSSSGSSVELYCNNDYEIVKFLSIDENFDFSFKTSFIATENINNVRFNAFFADEFQITEYQVKIFAKNVSILNKDQILKIDCFNDYYYITLYDEINGFQYGVQHKNSLNLDNLNYINIFNFYDYINYLHLVPTIENDHILTLKNNMQVPYRLIALKGTEDENCIIYDFNGTQLYPLNEFINIFPTCIDTMPLGMGYGSDVVIFTDVTGSVNAMGDGVYEYFIYQGQPLTEQWYSICSVKNNNANTGDFHNRMLGFVAWRKDNMNVFFPSNDSSYCVEIAKGRNTTAYYQEDQSIHIYINRNCCVYRYTLNLIDQEYKLSDEVKEYKGITKYCELYDNYALIFKNDQYKIILDN